MNFAALFVDPHGVYSLLAGADLWGPERDARLYAGPHPVVAHPPCARWGRYAGGSPRWGRRFEVGDDDGCFRAALASVRRWGGVLEHPAASKAWQAFNLEPPPRSGGWVRSGEGWVCSVEQGHYGHVAPKPTWLYAVTPSKPRELVWGPSFADGRVENLSKRQREATPDLFAALLVEIALTVREPAVSGVYSTER